ncbi:cell surface protein [Truncatella angustata]|uniref:Cell surface protein n=1 Tax=Truncatella angustata TaxID=152316 RepID=A0A9P8UBI1_9PEZI|nr:cell surface protein [Truncatella angustata]KAH6645411.1 cell surface protein [Truncatella angustata]
MVKTSHKSWVVMPLYYYPLTEDTWKPLHYAFSAHPDTNFLVIVNPNSGPGDTPLPSHDYLREVPKLNAYPNVYTVGYVRIDYCRKPLWETYGEIRRYADWHAAYEVPGLYVQGIFVDEVPNHFSAERFEYLTEVRSLIKNAHGLLDDRLVIHNPGTPLVGGGGERVEDLASFGSPDVVCICEVPHKEYEDDTVQKRLVEFSVDWSRSMYQISGIPLDQIHDVVKDLCQRGQYVFATDLVDDFYESFGQSWHKFTAAVGKSS